MTWSCQGSQSWLSCNSTTTLTLIILLVLHKGGSNKPRTSHSLSTGLKVSLNTHNQSSYRGFITPRSDLISLYITFILINGQISSPISKNKSIQVACDFFLIQPYQLWYIFIIDFTWKKNLYNKLEKKYAPALDNYGQSCFVRSDF
jgi:hypothetical protein